MTAKDLTMGIPTYNASRYILELLRSVDNSTLRPTSIIFHDDNSSDNTIELIKKYDTEIEISVIESDANVGHTVGSNRIIEATSTRYLLIGDHDIEFKNDTIEKLYNRAKKFKDDEAVVSAAILDTRFGDNVVYGTDLHYLISSSKRLTYEGEETGSLPSTGLILDLEKVGDIRYDDYLFIYEDDLDFFFRIKLRGYKLLIEKDALLIHKEGSVIISASKDTPYTSLRAFYVTRNRLIFYLKNYSFRTLFFLFPALLFFELINLGFSILKGTLSANLKAWKDFFVSMPQTLRKRSEVQSARIISDRICITGRTLTFSVGAMSGKIPGLIYPIVNGIFKYYFIIASKLI